MGCRNFTGVIVGGKIKVAQYGQWDGYPEGQGKTILNFLKTDFDREKFLKNAKRIRWATEDEWSYFCDKDWELLENTKDDLYHEKFGKDDNFHLGTYEANLLTIEKLGNKVKYPYMWRDHGAGILMMIQCAPDNSDIVLNNSLLHDENYGVDCEWAYIVNLDTNTLKVYSIHRNPLLPESETFLHLDLMSSFDINNLPSEEEFIRLCKVDKATGEQWNIWLKKCKSEGDQIRNQRIRERSENIKLQLKQLLAACRLN